jgi:hypothetical protein
MTKRISQWAQFKLTQNTLREIARKVVDHMTQVMRCLVV